MTNGTGPYLGREIWEEDQLLSDQPHLWSFGPLRLWCKRLGDELWLSSYCIDPAHPTDETTDTPPEEAAWSRWVLKRHFEKIRFRPVFPDRSVVVKPEYPFKILPGAKARIFVRVPAWVQIRYKGEAEDKVVEIPTVVLSKTWFGSPLEGERCYWISSRARRNVDSDTFDTHSVACPVLIINHSEKQLNVEELAMRVRRLSIFNLAGRLWSDETEITYRGNGEISRIEVTGKPPQEAKGAGRISPPREKTTEGFFAKTFLGLKDISSLSFFDD